MSKNDSSFQINKRSLLTAAIIIFALIVISYCLTLFLPPGAYERVADADGEVSIVPGTYAQTGDAGQYPVYNILLVIFKSFAPGGNVNVIMISIMLFILLIGGAFTLLDKSGILRAVVAKIASKMYTRRYLLIAVVSFVFMFLGSFFGILEEIVPLIPLVVGLSFMLGWDSLMGLGLSLLSTSFGFAAALYNPFSIAIAQKLAGVEIYSGTLPRLVFFALIYGLLVLFLIRYAKKLDKNPMASHVYAEDSARRDKYRLTPAEIAEAAKFKRAPMVFVGVLLALMFVFLISASFLGLADYSLVVIAIIFIAASIGGAKLAGYKGAVKTFFKGIADIAPRHRAHSSSHERFHADRRQRHTGHDTLPLFVGNHRRKPHCGNTAHLRRGAAAGVLRCAGLGQGFSADAAARAAGQPVRTDRAVGCAGLRAGRRLPQRAVSHQRDAAHCAGSYHRELSQVVTLHHRRSAHCDGIVRGLPRACGAWGIPVTR